MKCRILLAEGQGEVSAIPVLVRRLLQEKEACSLLYVDNDVIRRSPSHLIKWSGPGKQPDYSGWLDTLALAARRHEIGAVLAVYDGDAKTFPPGSGSRFCAATAAESMAKAAVSAGAGELFSLAVVFAISEYETWLVAGAESLAGRRFEDGRLALPPDVTFPAGDPESHGKRWLEQHCPGYRPTRHQAPLTKLLDFQFVRAKKLRSFTRLEHALDQLIEAVDRGFHVSTPRLTTAAQEREAEAAL